VIFQDLTRLVEIERELHRSERLAAVGQLAAGLAHEIRNPLGAISGAVELLAGGLPDLGPDPRRLVRIVQRETTRLDRLVVDFLAYARPGTLRTERCSVAEVLGEIAELLLHSDARGVRLEVEVPADVEVAGDPDALRQVLWNLVLNASESGPADGVVRVTATREPDPRDSSAARVRIEVQDRGSGMSPEVLDRLFEPFYTTKPKGTGLGLATVHRLVEKQAGSVAVHSEVGVGTRVAVVLPAAR
jgi:two-component system sensor histidine kinase PilS (NtrC family)